MTFGNLTATTTTSATGINNIDALLRGTQWQSNTVTFSFTDSFSNDYESGYPNSLDHSSSFQSLNATQREVAVDWIEMYESVSNLNMVELTGANDRNATIRLAESNHPSTAYAYYPAGTVEAGDIWFNRDDYNSPTIGNYAYHTFGHEIGHALGLEHGHETGGVAGVSMDADRDSMEFSIMTYRSYIDAPTDYYRNGTWDYAQSLMMYDIAAIQHMYGANFNTNSGNTTYTFSTTTGEMFVDDVGQGTPGDNRIFRTIWDGNGIDTYDFSNYTTNLEIDLTPGGWSNLDSDGNFQRAFLGDDNYARGHVFNALQYNGDSRSLIENAIGGSGNDSIMGNDASNNLEGGAGEDTIYGGSGNDTVDGGNGDDLIYLGEGDDHLNIVSLGDDTFYGGSGDDSIYGYVGDESYYGEAGNDTLKGFSGNDYLNGGDGDDVIYGQSGNDTVDGGNGNDVIYGGSGNDTVDGGNGNDLIYLGEGDDHLNIVSLGDDTFYGGSGDDSIYGYTGDESYYGEAGNDTLKGFSGNDYLNGGDGDDSLRGGDGDDSLNGGVGSDTLQGFGSGVEEDTLTGGDDDDTFILGDIFGAFYQGSDSYATITDFDWTEGDQIQVFGIASNYSFSHSDFLGDSSTDTSIYYDGELIAVLQDAYTSQTFIDEDFIFV